MQAPPLQTLPAPQATPQAPQFAGSSMGMHAPVHSRLLAHVHTP
jgi:hypothetical protein